MNHPLQPHNPLDLRNHFLKLRDHRIARNRRHNLIDIVLIVLSAYMSRMEAWDDIEEWAVYNYDRLASFLELPNGIPSHDTMRRVFERINPTTFQNCLSEWIAALRAKAYQVPELETTPATIAIDGKTVRGAGKTESGTPVLHSVSAWAVEAHLVLAQVKTVEKSNEITAIPALLRLIDIEGCTVTIDAMGCQRDIATAIIAHKGDYVLALKGNQSNLRDNVKGFFEVELANEFKDVDHQYCRTFDKGHGRIEVREYWQCAQLNWLSERHDWKGLASIVMVRRARTIKDTTTTEIQFYISSLPLDVTRVATAIRSHWSIENSLHWVLDVSFREDSARGYKVNTVENQAIIRRVTLNLLRSEGVVKDAYTPKKRLMAAYEPEFFFHVLLGTPYTPRPKPIRTRNPVK